MAFKRNMTRDEIVGFIDKELLPQVEREIGNWIYPEKQTGGYFVVSRQILCLVEFLGAVYSGYPRSEKEKDPNGNNIATSIKAKKFMHSFFKPKTTYNHEAITKLYSMYRHGLVHLYQPRVLKHDGNKVLQWFIYRGKRFNKTMPMKTPQGKFIFKNVSHLQILSDSSNKNYYFFPIGIDCLYKDFVNAVKLYRNKLIRTENLQTNWKTTINAILEPR